jgi:predicted dehydrogenase
MFRYHSQHAAVSEAVAAGTIGTVRSLTAEFTIPAPAPGDMRYDPKVGGGALLGIGVYPVRTALDFLGEDSNVAGATLNGVRFAGRTVGPNGARDVRHAPRVPLPLRADGRRGPNHGVVGVHATGRPRPGDPDRERDGVPSDLEGQAIVA